MSDSLFFNPYIGAVLSNDVYSNESAFVYGPLQEGVTRPELPDGYKNISPVSQYSDPYTGYFGRAYVNHDTSEVFYAHRGTEFSSVNDLSNDLQIATGKTPDQVSSAETFYNDFNKNYVFGATYNEYSTGHSLGGNISNVFGAINKIPSMTFDAPGDKTALDTFRVGDDGYNFIKENSLNILGPNNVVNDSGDFAGNVMRLDYPVNTTYIPQDLNAISGLPSEIQATQLYDGMASAFDYNKSAHSSENFINSFELDGTPKYDYSFEQITPSVYETMTQSSDINYATSPGLINDSTYDHFFGTNLYDSYESSSDYESGGNDYSWGFDTDFSSDSYENSYTESTDLGYGLGFNTNFDSNWNSTYESPYSLGVDTNFYGNSAFDDYTPYESSEFNTDSSNSTDWMTNPEFDITELPSTDTNSSSSFDNGGSYSSSGGGGARMAI